MSPTIKANRFGSSSSLFSSQDVIHESNREFLNSMIATNSPSSTANGEPISTSARFYTPNSMQRMIPVPPEITSTLPKVCRPILYFIFCCLFHKEN